MAIKLFASLGLFFLFGFSAHSQSDDSPTELGQVNWNRNLDKGISLSKKSDKPILLLFQEVPGCMTCQRYGSDVLSHPLIVETIERFFIPVAIYNNKGGSDAEVLKYFNEPAWNNPVVRIINADKENITERLSSNYSPSGLVGAMIDAISNCGQETPAYLKLLFQELSNDPTEFATYSMYCFWSGESHFGRKNGVVWTEPGFASGREVVKVRYDPSVIAKSELDKYAAETSCSAVAKPKNYKIDKEPKYYLSKSNFRFIPLSPLQQTKINGALGAGKDPAIFLSTKQQELLNNIRTNKTHGLSNVIYAPFIQSWEKVFN